MKIVILKNNLKTALDFIGKVIGKNQNLPILSNILIKTHENKLNIIGTDLEIGMTISVSGKIIEDGGVTVPYEVFNSIISNISNERINLETNNINLIIKTDNYEASIQGINENEFPIIPKIEEKKNYIKLNQGTLKQMFNKVILAAGENSMRPEINSVLMIIEPSVVKLVATDSFRLAEASVETNQKNSISEGKKIIIPLKTAQIISRVLKDDGEEDVVVYFDDTQILVKIDGLDVVSRVINGKFPDYESIIPKSYDSELILNRNELINALKLTGSFANKAKEVKIKIKDKKIIEIYSSDSSIGENKYIMPVKYDGPDLDIVFNLKYLLDGARADDSEQVYLGFNGDARPTIIKTPNQSIYFYVLMPVKST